MKADALLIVACLFMIYVAWIVTGGPNRPISTAGPYITPVTRSGEQSQGYRGTRPSNSLDTTVSSNPSRRAPETIGRTTSSGRTSADGTSVPPDTSASGSVDLNAR